MPSFAAARLPTLMSCFRACRPFQLLLTLRPPIKCPVKSLKSSNRARLWSPNPSRHGLWQTQPTTRRPKLTSSTKPRWWISLKQFVFWLEALSIWTQLSRIVANAVGRTKLLLSMGWPPLPLALKKHKPLLIKLHRQDSIEWAIRAQSLQKIVSKTSSACKQ